MAKKRKSIEKVVARPLSAIVNLTVWLTGILVSLAVGFGMAYGTLTIKWLTDIGAGMITQIAGWIVILLTIVSVVLSILDRI